MAWRKLLQRVVPPFSEPLTRLTIVSKYPTIEKIIKLYETHLFPHCYSAPPLCAGRWTSDWRDGEMACGHVRWLGSGTVGGGVDGDGGGWFGNKKAALNHRL